MQKKVIAFFAVERAVKQICLGSVSKFFLDYHELISDQRHHMTLDTNPTRHGPEEWLQCWVADTWGFAFVTPRIQTAAHGAKAKRIRCLLLRFQYSLTGARHACYRR